MTEDSFSDREAGGKETAMVLLAAIDNHQIVGISAQETRRGILAQARFMFLYQDKTSASSTAH